MSRSTMGADVVVLGAGISGLVAASVLLRQGHRSVVVVDGYDRVGGNHIDVAIGQYTFDVGSLIFQDDSPLIDHFPQLLEYYVPIDPTWSRINPQGVVTRYPMSFRDDFVALGPVDMVRTVASFARARMAAREMHSARDYAERALGRHFLRRSGLENYMERLCGSAIDDIELAFAESRMAWMRDQTRPRAVAERLWLALSSRPERVTNTQLARPRSGFATLYGPVVEDLTSRGAQFVLGHAPDHVEQAVGGLTVVAGPVSISTGRVISTIPVARAMSLVGLSVPPLPSVTLLSLFYSFEGDRGFQDPILYNFTDEAHWKRLTVYSDLYGIVAGRQYLTVEVVQVAGALTPEAADMEIRPHLRRYGLFDGDLRLEGHHVLEHAYPVFLHGSTGRAALARRKLAGAGIESFGRQGAFRYQPTARVSTIEAESALGAPLT